MGDTTLYQITETSPFMMSFVIITGEDHAIVIDGGREEDMPLLKQYIGGRHISAWILTHPHLDHISGFIAEYRSNGAADFDIEKIYYHFPPFEQLHNPAVPEEYRKVELGSGTLADFLEVLPQFRDKAHIALQGESVVIDEVKIDFLFSYHSFLTGNLMNDSSLAFKVTAPHKTVLFLGDLGPEAGDVLYRESRHLLKADIVQMAHHGHSGVGMEVYAAASPTACLWCCPEWLYNESEIPAGLENAVSDEKLRRAGRHRMYGTVLTRKWMEQLGATQHYVTKDGTQKITL